MGMARAAHTLWAILSTVFNNTHTKGSWYGLSFPHSPAVLLAKTVFVCLPCCILKVVSSLEEGTEASRLPSIPSQSDPTGFQQEGAFQSPAVAGALYFMI